ncbi:hypothetical protein [Anatilimnocola floriformis]|uniref:hypothetical protein n=1 Tax=Anatilimnocola floriformis TaxID=2948575 RepID=UPI0020C4F934|nr:hypothetical protein [Anatilimnocola floriformis]
MHADRPRTGLACICFLWLSCLAVAQEKSLDEQLLDDLKPPPAKVKPVSPPKPADKPASKLDEELRRDLGGRDLGGEDLGQEKKEEHPLLKLGREMREVQERIAAKDTAEGTQQKQKEIAAELAKLIEQAQKKPQGSKQQGNQNNKPSNGSTQSGANSGDNQPQSQPGQQSTQRLEQGEQTQAQMNEVKEAMRRIWGHLPEKEREEMIGALGEQFLPKYERLIEAFYKRLAERPAARP